MKDVETRVWDPLVRIGHWLLAAAFVVGYASGDDAPPMHVYAGYMVLGVILFRVIWGFIGTPHARFSDFVRPWGEVREHLASVMRLSPKSSVGHNPAGGWMVILLLVMLLATSLSGAGLWILGEGSVLGEGLEEAHEFLANTTLLLVVIHVGGVLVESLLSGENLIKAMLTGRKPAAPSAGGVQ